MKKKKFKKSLFRLFENWDKVFDFCCLNQLTTSNYNNSIKNNSTQKFIVQNIKH